MSQAYTTQTADLHPTLGLLFLGDHVWAILIES